MLTNLNETYPGLHLLKGIAAFGIVGCHLFLQPMTPSAESLLHFCDMNVGVFGTVSGFLLAMSFVKRPDMRSSVARRVRRILPAYGFWTVVFVLAKIFLDLIVRGGAINEKFLSSSFWISAILMGGSSTHLWYLAWLFWFSLLLIALWSAMPSVFLRPSVLLMISLLSLVGCVVFGFGDYNLRLLAFMSLGATIYQTKDFLHELPVCTWFLMLIVALCIHMDGMRWPAFVRDWVVCAPLVVVFTLPFWSSSKAGSILGDNSFGVYLIHPLLTMAFSMVAEKFIGRPTTALVLIMDWAVVCLLSSIISYLLRRFRFTQWTVR